MKAYSVDLRQKIVEAVSTGTPKTQVARAFGVGLSTVKRYASRAQRPDEVSGVFICADEVMCIGVNEHHPRVRQRFGRERELFVDFLEADTAGLTEDGQRKSLEVKANQYAADLLMPRSWIRADVERHGLDVALLARRYEVSEQALWFRFITLKLVQDVEVL